MQTLTEPKAANLAFSEVENHPGHQSILGAIRILRDTLGVKHQKRFGPVREWTDGDFCHVLSKPPLLRPFLIEVCGDHVAYAVNPADGECAVWQELDSVPAPEILAAGILREWAERSAEAIGA